MTVEQAAKKTRPNRSEAKTVAKEEQRTQRVPIGTMRSKMAVPEVPGYFFRWVVGNSMRMNELHAAGYVKVTNSWLAEHGISVGDFNVTSNVDETSEETKRQTGIDKYGAPSYSFLMRQKLEHYEEDQALKAQRVDENERGLSELEGADADLRRHLYKSKDYANGEGFKIGQ